MQRETSYMSWAQSEFKIPSVTSTRSDTIKNETDFILKVRNKHIKQRNLTSTLIIQKWWKMKMTQKFYNDWKKIKLRSIILIQSMVKMKWKRR
jgi:hypothetical protein